MLGAKTSNAVWFETPHEIADRQSAEQKEKNFGMCIDHIIKNAAEGDLVITLGCGDVYKLAKELAKGLREK